MRNFNMIFDFPFINNFKNNNMKTTLIISLFIIIFIGILSCNKDEEPAICSESDVSYNGDIKRIIDNSCAFSASCHQGNWAVIPNFTTYETLKPSLENGEFEERTFFVDSIPTRVMPPPNTPEENLLTEDDRQLLRCWIDNGFPEN